MTTVEEFQQKVKEIKDKIDFQNNSPQKILTLLQYIKDLCAHSLEGSSIDPELEKEVQSTLFQVERDMAKYKTQPIANIQNQTTNSLQSPDSNKIQSSIGTSTIPTEPLKTRASNTFSSINSQDYIPPQPIKPALDSVQAGAFDPMSSPILRRMLQKKTLPPTSKLVEENKTSLPNAQTISSQPLDSSEMSKKDEKNFENQNKNNTMTPALSPQINASPFPTLAPFPSKPIDKGFNLKLYPAILEIPQLQTKIKLPFTEAIEQIGRQDFLDLISNSPIEIPKDFFDPIVEKNQSNMGSTEHCIIEQSEKGKFILKDRFNQQKTFFDNIFIDEVGKPLKEGDNFILPVLMNGQIVSLSLTFHIEKE